MWRNIFLYELHALTSNGWFGIRCQTRITIRAYSLLTNPGLSVAGVLLLIHPKEWKLTIRSRGSSNHNIFLILVDLNHLHPELQASALTTHILSSKSIILEYALHNIRISYNTICTIFNFKIFHQFKGKMKEKNHLLHGVNFSFYHMTYNWRKFLK